MRIAVMATGGVGGYFGAKLAQGGHEVSFVARGRHLAAMRERGLAVKSANGDIRIAQPSLVDPPPSIGRRRALRGQALGYEVQPRR
jgi:2-dehydropantoate 2-reductase